MNAVTASSPHLDYERVRYEVDSRDRQMAHPFSKDLQVMAIRLGAPLPARPR